MCLSSPAQAYFLSPSRPNPGIFQSSFPVALAGGGGGGGGFALVQSTANYLVTSAGVVSSTFNASVTVGNLLVAWVTASNNVAITMDGWNAMTSANGGSGASQRSGRMFWTIVNSTTPNWAQNDAGGNSARCIVLAEFSGITASNALNVESSQLTAAAATHDTPSVSPQQNINQLVVTGYMYRGGVGSWSGEIVSGGRTSTELEDVSGNTLNTTAMAYNNVDSTLGSFTGTATPADSGKVGATAIATFRIDTSYPTLVQEANSQASASLAYGSDTTAGNLLWMYSTGYTTPGPCTPSSISSSGGNTWHIIHSSGGVGNANLQLMIGYAANAVGGAETVTVNYSGSCSPQTLYVSEWSGINTTSPLEYSNASGASGVTTHNTGNLKASANTGLMLAASAIDAGGTQVIAQDNPWTLEFRETDGSGSWPSQHDHFGSTSTFVTDLMYRSTFTHTNTNTISMGAVFKK